MIGGIAPFNNRETRKKTWSLFLRKGNSWTKKLKEEPGEIVSAALIYL